MRIVCNFIRAFLLLIVVGYVCQARVCFSAEEVEGKVNINTATEAQIALLPGIGSKLAGEIVSYRMSNGNFKTIEDIKKVSGVGDKKFDKIKDFLVLEGDTTLKSTKAVKSEKDSK